MSTHSVGQILEGKDVNQKWCENKQTISAASHHQNNIFSHLTIDFFLLALSLATQVAYMHYEGERQRLVCC